MSERIKVRIQESAAVKQLMLEDEALISGLESLSRDCLSSLREGGKIVFAGNGGSFADAQHISAEFTSRFLLDRHSLASVALGTNGSAISAIGNDYGFEHIFSREMSSIANEKDVFIGITTSGNSPNILRALEIAAEKKIRHAAFTGATGGKLNGVCECLKVPSQITARIQECHILMGHILCELVEEAFFQKKEI